MLARSTLAREVVCYGAPWLRELIGEVSRKIGVPARALELRALLHLPRLADQVGEVESSAASDEVHRLAREMPPESEWLLEGTAPPAAALTMTEIPEATARWICERFHYLGSHRLAGGYYGAFAPGGSTKPVAIVVTTELDVASLAALLGPPELEEHARVVARVFAFPGAPRNTISRLLGFVGRAEGQRLGARRFLTYVNPNLGFSGTSYLASGWKLAGDEPGTRYRYVDGRYVTDRELVRRYGSCDNGTLSQALGARFECSSMVLAPLLVFSRALRSRE